MTRNEILDIAIFLQDKIREAKAKQAEEQDSPPEDSASDFWLGMRMGLGIAERELQKLLLRG